jgi:ABC-type lipoprotein export system ATPase subunit
MLVQVDNVSKIYDGNGGAQTRALLDVSLAVEAAEFIAIAGPSGSGKSTLLSLIGLLNRPSKGRIIIAGQESSAMSEDQRAIARRQIGFVFQDFQLIPILTAAENVRLVMELAGHKDPLSRTVEVFEAVSLGGMMHKFPGQLSGGERQRVAIARALANRPRLLLADEPTGNLTTATSHEIVGLLKRVSREDDIALIVASHNPEIAAAAERSLRLLDGRLV